MRIVFMGSGSFACPAVQALAESASDHLAAVVTQPDRPRGRALHLAECPVKALIQQRGIPVLTPGKVGDAYDALKQLAADLYVVTDYGQYIPSKVLALPPRGAINIHPSLLPRYRGASPMQMALAHGDTLTGVTILYVSNKMDAGDVILQQEHEIAPDDTARTLEARLAAAGATLLLRAIDLIRAGHVHALPQDEARATYAPKLEKAAGRIDWTLPAQAILNRVRGFDPWPGTFTQVPGGSLKILTARVEPRGGRPGRILEMGEDGPLVACGEQSLRLLRVQPEGRKAMSGAEYGRGLRAPMPETLG